ncbi:L-type lectin-domain containing receptor kinase IX.2 [Manihot esculenta]|uniref:Uncharacterized protein n=1 Tax=Manihot esculenta TaxID=3983 RepID=A0ACB7HDZ1_MANES|nr:L-type lectin-domain containing receptor kinase IX.2 [Manihot esculenta]KAG8650460.1 hypothetical protein MANES_07G043600v8 [Manihot esculenta]
MDIHHLHLQSSKNLSFCIFISLLLLTFFLLKVQSSIETTSFSFNQFSPDMTEINFEGQAYAEETSIQLTNSFNKLSAEDDNNVGRATYYKPIHLWDDKSGNIADFTTYFSFIINSHGNESRGNGFAFFLTNKGSKLPPLSGEGRLGLLSYNSVTPPFVAVEFDTRNSFWDPVDGDEHIGFSASTAIYKFEEHEILEWNFNSTLQLDENFTNHTGTGGAMSPIARISTKGKNKGWILVVLGSIGALVLVSSVLGLLWCGHRKKRRSRRTEDDEPGKANDDFEREDRPRSFSYEELVTATNNFASERLLGKGGFGRVYIGMLSENSCVAVKKIITSDSHQGFKAYVSEVKAISRSRHRNLVQLIGWCRNKQELFIVYEFMPNKSLDFHLFNKTGLLTWERRNSIALGLASALLYLQEECEQCVLHRDIKSSNVLLDSNFNAKLGDFGLATFVEHGQGSDTTRLIGTDGYVAPEYLLTSTATKESDVYSFGVVALEIASGRPASKAVINENGERCQGKLVAWVWEQYRRGNIFAAADPQLHQNYDREEMERLIVLGLACAHPNHSLRPSIREALDILNAKAPLPKLPLDMPIATYQLNMNAISESSSIDAGVSETKFSGSSVNS